MAFRKTLLDLRTAVRDNLDESTAAFWPDATLNRFLSRAVDVVFMEARKLRQDWFTVTRTSTDGTVTIFGENYDSTGLRLTGGTLTLPQDCVEVRMIECVTSGYEDVLFVLNTDIVDPGVREIRQISNNTNSGSGTRLGPSAFFCQVVSERTIYVTPLSDTNLDLRVIYVSSACIFTNAAASLTAFASDTDTLQMPFPLYLAVEELATVRAKLKELDAGMAGVWQQQAAATVARFLGSSVRQSQDPIYGWSALE